MRQLSDYIWIFLALFIIVDLFLLAWIVYSKSRIKFSLAQQRQITDHWCRIKNEDNSKYQVLEAAKVVEQVLKMKGFRGSFGEYLKTRGALFSNLNGLWAALKLRNKIAHELTFEPDKHEIKVALQNFEKALKDMKILLK